MTERKAILDIIRRLREDLGAAGQFPADGAASPGLDSFILLLGGIASCRKVPGLESQMGFDTPYRCSTQDEADTLRSYLGKMFDITDRTSLLDACDRLFSVGMEYAQFLSFWAEMPAFDENALSDSERAAFRACMDYAGNFRDIVGDRGFYAWDINERIGLMRAACACGVITERELRAIGWELAKLATDVYSSWQEYALSCICGAVYFMFVQNGRQEGKLKSFCEINDKCIRHLFHDAGCWAGEWYSFPEKHPALPEDKLVSLLENHDGPTGCLATDRIVMDGATVGYMYREKPEYGEADDSGWRFFAGDEDEDYLSNPDNSGVYHLNTICNYSRDIVPLLASPYGTAYSRGEDGVLREEKPSRS